ncbi:MAG: ABC transporter permease [Deltaproteobacteria bacterium]|nr:ABC transporter permease [Deltaproteobacteria bacterium]MBI4223447.1 ABC transporter permease [Deltaproteobacteria bacterium]
MRLFFKKAWAFLKRDLREGLSYKSAYLFQIFGIFANILTFFFVAKIFGEGAGRHLQNYGGEYFPFVLIGIACAGYQGTALSSFSRALSREQGAGTLEAILMTPTTLNTIMLSGSLWTFSFTSLRLVFYLLAGAVFFGVDMSKMNVGASLCVLLLSITALAGLGIFQAGFMLVFKRGNPLGFFLNGASRFLSGVYFPVALLPEWVQGFSHLLPLTYSLEAMRKALLQGESLAALGGEILGLILFTVFLLPMGILFFNWAVRRAKREGSLGFS